MRFSLGRTLVWSIAALLVVLPRPVAAEDRGSPAGTDLITELTHPPPRSAAVIACQEARLKWLHTTITDHAEDTEAAAAWHARFDAWCERWCKRDAGMPVDAAGGDEFTTESELVAAGCAQPLLLYAYAAELDRRERHVECEARLNAALQALADGDPPYLACLATRLKLRQCFLPRTDQEGTMNPAQGSCELLLRMLKGPGDRAMLERVLLGVLLRADARFEWLTLRSMNRERTTMEAMTVLLRGQGPQAVSPWLRHCVAALDAASQLASGTVSSDAMSERLRRTATTEWTDAWAADPRWPEPSEQILLVMEDTDDPRLWLKRGLQVDASDGVLVDNYLDGIGKMNPDRLLKLAQLALASRRFDGPVPALYLRFLSVVDASLQYSPMQRRSWWNEARWHEVQQLVNGYIDALAPDRDKCRYWESVRIAAAWRCGKQELARQRLRSLAGPADQRVLDMFGISSEDLAGWPPAPAPGPAAERSGSPAAAGMPSGAPAGSVEQEP